MAVIKTMQEIIQEQLEIGARTASSTYREAVRPIYGVDKNGAPNFIGSCFLFEICEKKCIVTAAHVVDHAHQTSLMVGGMRDLVTLEGDFRITQAPNGTRENDHYDFAWSFVTEEFMAALGNVGIIHEADIAPRRSTYERRVYLCLGYPRSKNKKADPTTRKLRPKYARYYSTWKPMNEMYAEMQISGDDHIAISRKIRSRDGDGNLVNSIGPRGMSGGPLFDLGSMVSVEELASGRPYSAKLAGVQIEHDAKHSAIVSVKIDLVIDDIRAHLST